MNNDDFIRRKDALNAEIRIEVDIPPYKTRTIKAAEGAIQSAVTAYTEHLRSIPAADVRPVVRGAWKPNPRNPYWLDCTVSTIKQRYFHTRVECPGVGIGAGISGLDTSGQEKAPPE